MEKNKAALVTGGGQGIGEAICKRLSKDGFAIGVSDINFENAQKVANDIIALGGKAIAIKLNVANRDEMIDAVEKTYQAFGDFNVMVNNAAICPESNFATVTEEDFKKIYDINVGGVIWGAQAASNKMIELGHGGAIISASSQAGVDGYPGLAFYSSTKFAVRGITQVLGRDLAPLGINVNAYAPGIVVTPMLEGLADRMGAEAGKDRAWAFETFEKGIAQRKVTPAEQIASGVSFLAGEDSKAMVGQTLIIDGGMVYN